MNKAIYEHYAADAALVNALKNGLFEGEAPVGTEYPYGVFNVVKTSPQHKFGKLLLETHTIQFELYSESVTGEQVNSMFYALKCAFDFAQISSDDFKSIAIDRQRWHFSGTDGVWQCTVLYRIQAEVKK